MHIQLRVEREREREHHLTYILWSHGCRTGRACSIAGDKTHPLHSLSAFLKPGRWYCIIQTMRELHTASCQTFKPIWFLTTSQTHVSTSLHSLHSLLFIPALNIFPLTRCQMTVQLLFLTQKLLNVCSSVQYFMCCGCTINTDAADVPPCAILFIINSK